ncbi:MAG: hypothetical protein ISS35_00060 [Kiritimatiellae bacterium]|nr:hypothetical protein [Kiritimatiellia bacterium]
MICRNVAVCVACALLLSGFTGCTANRAGWELKKIGEIGDFNWPEAIRVDHEAKRVFVANIETSTKGGWEADGKGFISVLYPDGSVIERKWRSSNADFTFNAPKGMTILNEHLYIADISRLLVCPLDAEKPIRVIDIPGAQWLNDISTDGNDLYVSDTKSAKAYRVDLITGTHNEIKAPEWINGITSHKGHLYCVSIKLHELYELDPSGERDPIPFGLKEYFVGPDGIEVLKDDSFIISDVKGDRLLHVTADRKYVSTLAEVPCPADIAIDPKRNLLYAPSLFENKVTIFKLTSLPNTKPNKPDANSRD